MVGFRDAVGAALGQLACSASRGYRSLTQGNPLAGALLGGAIPEIGSYLLERLYCPRDPYDEPYRPAPCPIEYGVTVTWQITGHPNPALNTNYERFGRVYGPIGTASWARQDVDEPGGRQVYFISLVHNGFVVPPAGQSPTRQPWSGPGEFDELARLVILGVNAVPVDPLADNECLEDRRDTPYDPADYTYDIDIVYDIGGPNIIIPFIAVVGLLYVDADFNLKMPVTFNLRPTLNFSPSFNFNFQADLNLTTGDTEINWYTDRAPGQPPSPIPPAPRPPAPSPTGPAPPVPPGIPEPEPAPDDPEGARVIVAALVTSTVDFPNNEATEILQGDNPNLFVPSLGVISFASRSDITSFGWTTDLPVKNLRSYIPCPIPEGASAVKGTPRTGVEWVITPIYANRTIPEGV